MISCLCELCFLLKTREVVGGCGPHEDAARFLSGGLTLNRVRFFALYRARQEAAAELLDLRSPPQVPGAESRAGLWLSPHQLGAGKATVAAGAGSPLPEEFNFSPFFFPI